MRKAIKSDIGAAYIIPPISTNCGSIIISGGKNIICFDSDKVIPSNVLPMEGKKVDIVICMIFICK